MRYVALIVLAACGDPAVEMKLVAAKTNAAVDLSCVTAVDILPLAKDDAATLDIGNREYYNQQKLPCATISGAKTIDDVQAQLASQIDIPIPAGGLAGLELRGREGTCDEIPAYRDAVFYGGALVDMDQDSLAIPVRYNVMCGQMTTYTARPIDLPTLVKTKACPATTDGNVFEGTVRPSLLDAIAPPLFFENGLDIEVVDSTGTGKLTAPAASFSESCPSVGWQNKDGTAVVSTCVNATAPTACGQPGEIEIPTVTYDYASHVFGTTPNAAGNTIIGAVWSKSGGPVTGATITPDEGATATVTYGDVGTSTFTTMPSLTATNASGMFVVYSNSVLGITVSAPGHTSQHVWVGAGAYMPGTALVVLP